MDVILKKCFKNWNYGKCHEQKNQRDYDGFWIDFEGNFNFCHFCAKYVCQFTNENDFFYVGTYVDFVPKI